MRAEGARQTRATIVEAARALLLEDGAARLTVKRIADRAAVNVDTVYRSVGRKPEVLRAVVESAISGLPEAVPAEQRSYVQNIRDAATAAEKLEIYAEAITHIQERLAPVFRAIKEATNAEADLLALWNEISARRAANMRLFAQDLRATGELRSDLDDDTVADIIWSMNGPELWVLLVDERGWMPAKFKAHLLDSWRRMLLA